MQSITQELFMKGTLPIIAVGQRAQRASMINQDSGLPTEMPFQAEGTTFANQCKNPLTQY